MDEPIAPAIPIDGVADQPVPPQPTPSAVPPPREAPPAAPPAPVEGPSLPPPWSAVEGDPGFTVLPPERKLAAFARWHNDAYNHAATLPDWEEHKEMFNNKAAEVQSKLSEAAGGLSPQQARAKIATDTLAAAASTTPLDRETQRGLLAGLPKDVRDSYFKEIQDPEAPGFVHEFLNAGRVAGSDVGAGVFNAFGGLAAKAGANPEPGLFQRLIDPFHNDPVAVENRKKASDILRSVANYWGKRAEGLGAESGVDPKLAGATSTEAAHFLSGTAVALGEGMLPEVGIPILLGHNALQRYGEVYHETGGDAAAADRAAKISLLGNALFIGQGEGVVAGLNKVLGTGAEGIKGWAIKAAAATGGNLTTGQIIKAADSAANAPEGQRMKAFTDGFQEMSIPDAALQTAFGMLAASTAQHPAVGKAKAEASALKADAEASAAKLEAAGAPETAKAERQVAAQTANDLVAQTSDAVAASPIRLSTAQDAEGSYTHNLDVPATVTAEQLKSFADTLDTAHLPPEAVATLQEQLAQEIAARTAKPTAEQPKTPETATTVPVTPESVVAPDGMQAAGSQSTGEHVLSSAVKQGDKYLVGGAANTGHAGIGAFHDLPGEVPEAARGFLVQRADGKVEFVARDEAGRIADATRQRTVNSGEPLQAQELTNAPLPTVADGDLVKAAKRNIPEPETRAVVAPEGDLLAPAPPARPLAEPATPPGEGRVRMDNPRTPEEKAAQITEGQTRARALVEEGGIVPTYNELHKMTGDPTTAKALRKELEAKVAEQFPPEPLGPGEKEAPGSKGKAKTLDKYLTGDVLPTVINEAGQIRPRFSGDPGITALQIDSGTVGTTPGARLYVPTEMLADHLNPAIRVAKERDTGRAYVIGADVQMPDGSIRHITEPGQFTEDYQAIRRLQGDAQKMIGLAPEELQGVRTAVEKGVAEKKLEFGPFEFDAEAPDLVDPGEAPAASDTIKVESRGNFPVEEADVADVNNDEHVIDRIVKNHTHLDQLGIDPESIKKPGVFKDVLTNISRNKEIAWTQRILAKFLMKTGIDFSNLKLDVTSKPLDYTAATWEGSKGNLQDAKIWLNAAGHFSNLSEVAGALLHEAVHHVTLFKLDNSYQRTVFEEASYRMLRKSYDKAVEASFERLYGVKGTPEQLSAFIKAQDTGETVNGIEPHRDLYGLGNIYEFAAETMSNSRFQKILSNFEGLGVALGGRKFNNLLRLVQQGLKNLFAGQPITRGSLLDDAVSHAFNFAGSGPDAERITSNKPVSRGLITRGDLVDLAKEQGMGDLVDTLSEKELRSALGIEGARPVEPEVKRTTVSGDGWLTPSGEFEPARFDDAHWKTLAENEGGFAGAGRAKLDPAAQAEFDKATRDKNGRIDSSLATKFFRDRGFVRVVDRGDMLLIEGNLTDAHRKQLIDAAVEKGVPLVQDLGGNRQHILFEPAAGTEPTPRLTRAAASLEDLRKPESSKGRDLSIDEAGNLSYSTIAESRKGPEDKNAPDLLKAATPRITHEVNAEGKVEHKLEIPPVTPAEDLVKLADNIANAKIPEADKERMTAELAAAMQDRLTKQEVSGVSNARVDASRVKRGLPPRMEPLRRALGLAWTEAMDQIANDPTSGNRIINDVNKVVRGRGTLSDVETAILAHEQVVRENAFDNAVEQMNNAKTPEEKAAADARMSAARDAMDEVYRAAERTGTWAGQSLAARKILLNSDFTLARMEAMKKAANAGVLSEEHIKEVHTAFEAIKAAKTKADIVDELAAMQIEVDLLKELLATKDPAKAAKIREQLAQKARVPLTNDQLLERYKKALATRTKALEAKLAAGDFTKNVRAKTHLDQEALDAQVAYKRLRQKFEEGLLKDEAKRRPIAQKALDILVDFVRAGVISSPIAYGKLLAAAAARMVLTPTEQVLGAALSKVPGISQIAKLAPREGSFSGKAEGLAIARALTHGVGKDVGQVFRTGKTDLDVLYGRPDIKPRGKLLDWVGRTHQVIKAPVLRAEFERSYSMLYDHLKANGTDVSDPMVRMDIGLEAYRNAEKAIFKNNNRATDAYKAALAGIERKNARTGKSPLLAKAVTSLIKTELPVVGVPTNIAAETMQYVFGSVTGLTKVAAALAKGVEKLHPEEADQIMRHLKKGSLGLAAAALAFYLDPDDFEAGGFYVQGEKRSEGALEPESLRIAGVTIDHHYLHNPYVLAMQVFAAARRAADEGLHGDKAKGPGSAALSALFGLGETVPFTKLFTDVGAAMDDNKRSRMMAEMLKSDTIPQLVQFFAKLEDKDEEGNTIQRKADFSDGQLEGTLQTLSTGIPPVIEDLTGGRIKGRKSVDEKP